MQLPGRLRATTLGDLLGSLHRAEASGTLELSEERGDTHRVHFSSGLVVAVETKAAPPWGTTAIATLLRDARVTDDDTLRRALVRALASDRLVGDVLVRDFGVSSEAIHEALARQIRVRLTCLEQLRDARVSFRLTVPRPRGALSERPVPASEFLTGRRRARDAKGAPVSEVRPRTVDVAKPAEPDAASSKKANVECMQEWTLLGVPPGSARDDIKRAFRRRVRELHPDLHPSVSEPERQSLARRFAAVTAAYRKLVA